MAKLIGAWAWVQGRPWWSRWPLKWAFVGIVTFFVLYPRPRYFLRHVRHTADANRLIAPDAAALQGWRAELESRFPAGADAVERQRIVEKFVYEKVPYAFDWDTWGVVDYLPTVEEVIAAGREDCDGRALVAASLLRRYDPTVHLVSDFKHVWIASAAGEAMGPGPRKVVEVTPEGERRVQWANALDATVPAVGMALFPLRRELVIAAAALVALCDPRMGRRAALVAVGLAIHGLLVVRLAAADPRHVVLWGAWLGYGQIAAAVGLAVWASRRGAALPGRGPVADARTGEL
jgi:hypothetical protein